MSTPSLGGGGATRSVQVVLGANAAPAVQGMQRFAAAATEAGKTAERAALQAKAAQDRQAKAASDAAKVTQAAAAKAAEAQLKAVQAAQAHARAVAAGSKEQADAAKAAAAAAKLSAQEQAAAARLVRVEQQKAAREAVENAKVQAAAAREAAAQQVAAARQVQAAQRQAAAQQAAYDRAHAAAVAENARRVEAALRAQQAAARQAAAAQAAMDRLHGQAIAENSRRELAARRATTAAARQAAAAQAAMDRQHAAAIAENARRTQAANAAALAGQRRLGQQMANDLRRQSDLDRQHQDALDENARREEDRSRRAASAQKKVGGGLLAGGAVAAVGVLASVAAAAKLEQAMSRVQAATGSAASEMGALRAAAIDAGERTQYSSVEAADGIEQLAKAGLSTAAILSGGLDAALNLAAADGVAVGDAAEYIATTLNQFNLAGADATHVADLLAAAAGEASGNVTDAALALSYVGPVAAGAKVPLEEVVGSIALLSSNGVLAEKAGTGLRGTILALTSPSHKAGLEMQSLGLHLYDAAGHFVGIRGAAEQLQVAFGGLTQEQRDYSLGVIFGNNQVTAANLLLKSGAEGVDEWTKKVDDQGRAAEMASTRTNNLAGDVERLGGALNSAFVGTGEGGLTPLRALTQGLTSVVSGYNDLDSSSKATVLVLATVASGASLAGGAFLLLAPRIVATRAALSALLPPGSRAVGVMRGLGAAAAGATALLVVAEGIKAIQRATDETYPGVETLTSKILALNSGSGPDALGKEFDDLGESIDRVTAKNFGQKLGDTLQTPFVGIFGKGGGLREAESELSALDEALTGLVSRGGVPLADKAFQNIASSWHLSSDQAVRLRGLLPGFSDAIKGVDNSAKLATDGQETLGAATGDTTEDIKDERTAVELLTDSLDALNGGAISATQAQIAFRTAQRDGAKALKDAAKASKDHTISLNANTKAGGENLDTVLGQIQAAEQYGEAVAKQAEGTLSADAAANKGRGAYKARIADLKATWHEAGLTNAQIDRLLKKYAQVPSSIKTETSAPGALEAARQAADVRKKVLSIPEQFRTGVFLNDQASPFLPGIESRLQTLTRPRVIDIRTYFQPAPIPAGVAAPIGPRVPSRAEGGPIPGPFIGAKADNVLIAATPGEYMQQHAAVQHYGLDAMDAINQRRVPQQVLQGYANGGQILGYAAGGAIRGINNQYAAAVAPGATGAQIARAAQELARLAQAWRDANEAAEQAAQRVELVKAEAKSARELAKAKPKERAEAKKAHAEDVKALRDFDTAARKSRLDAAVASKEQRANNRAEYEFDKLTQAQQLASIAQRMKGERKYSDEWVSLAKQRDDILAEQAAAAAARTANQAQYEFDHSTTDAQLADVDRRLAAETRYSDKWMELAQQREALQGTLNEKADQADEQRQQNIETAADRLNQLLDERDGILGELTQAQGTYDDAVKAANSNLAEQTAQIVASRREALAAMDLTKRASAGTGVSVASLLKNAASQVETFTAFMEQLDLARARGLSEDVIKTLDLERGPEALTQLRKLNAGTADDITKLNALVGQRLALAGGRAQAEATTGAGQVGADVAAARTDAQAQIDAARADLTATTTDLNARLAAVGADTGRDYTTAIADGLTAGIPAVAAAATALQNAVAVPLAGRITITPVPGRAMGGVLPGPFVGPRADNVVYRGTPGEFVTNVAATRKHRPLLEAINADRVPGYADGGYVHTNTLRSAAGGTTQVRADVDTWGLEMRMQRVVERLDTLTGTVRAGQRDKSITASPNSW